jgi:hypothetical protein
MPQAMLQASQERAGPVIFFVIKREYGALRLLGIILIGRFTYQASSFLAFL